MKDDMRLIRLRAERLVQRVNLHLALGGGLRASSRPGARRPARASVTVDTQVGSPTTP